MRLRKPPRPSTPEENRARNIARIMNPPTPTLRDRIHARLWAVDEWWRRHVTHRELYRRLNDARVHLDSRFAAERPERPL